MSDLISLCNNLSDEADTLRARLAECERERDESRRAVDDPTLARLHALRDEMLTATVEALGAVKAERDAAIQRAERAEADTAASIEAWLRWLDDEPARQLAECVKRGNWHAWRGKEGA